MTTLVTIRDIAQARDMSPGGVRSRLSRAGVLPVVARKLRPCGWGSEPARYSPADVARAFGEVTA